MNWFDCMVGAGAMLAVMLLVAWVLECREHAACRPQEVQSSKLKVQSCELPVSSDLKLPHFKLETRLNGRSVYCPHCGGASAAKRLDVEA